MEKQDACINFLMIEIRASLVLLVELKQPLPWMVINFLPSRQKRHSFDFTITEEYTVD